MDSICPALTFNESKIIAGINKELGTHIENIEEAYDEVDKVRYDRFNKLVDDKFTDDKLLQLLDNFDNRTDGEISQMVTDNADIPTIFEYVPISGLNSIVTPASLVLIGVANSKRIFSRI